MDKTSLYDEHVALGARMVEFAGYLMPVQYKSVIEEHNAVRKNAGMFDVSHMGEFLVTGKDAEANLQKLTTNDVSKLENNKAQYSMFLYENGTVVDDIIIYRKSSEEFVIVVNADNRQKDFDWVKSHIENDCKLNDVSNDYSLIAVQGPNAVNIVQCMTNIDVASLESFSFKDVDIKDVGNCIVARTGYTGEDGFELFVSPENAVRLWRALLKAGVIPAGLGARDVLRLEARMSLYGHEISDHINPLEAGLSWAVKIDNGNFIGREALLKIKEEGLKRKLIGFEMVDPGIARGDYKIKNNGNVVGFVTSGVMSPTLGKAIGLAFVPIELAKLNKEFFVDIRGKERKARVCKTPFYKRA